jgi:hypothetical protein
MIQISLSKLKSSTIEQGKRFLKVLQFGAKTAKESYPFGFDSVPPADWTAIYAETTNKDESVIIGYINRNQLASIGESRIYALGSNKEVTAFLWAKSQGDLLLNGSNFTAVRFDPLDTALQTEKSQINAELIKIQIAIASLGGSYTISPINIDVSNAESSTVKLK